MNRTAALSVADTAGVFSAIAAWGSLFAVLVGVTLAHRQLREWRNQAAFMRKADRAEELFVKVHQLADFFEVLRSPFGYSDPDNRRDETYDYRRRVEMIKSKAEDFNYLRELELRQSAVIGSKEISHAVADIFTARATVLNALLGIIEYISDETNADYPGMKELYRKDRQTLWPIGRRPEDDECGAALIKALETAKKVLLPFIRLELSKASAQ